MLYSAVMVSAFPELLSFGLLAPTILRLAIGFFFAFEALDMLERGRAATTSDTSKADLTPSGIGLRLTAYAHLIIGALLVVGLFTQVAALAAVFLCFALLRLAPHPLYAPRERVVYKLLFFIALSLIVLGPGIFAFDLPL
jgi:uncharacterized membrane protein YphA (DoxX/SURF4 family)